MNNHNKLIVTRGTAHMVDSNMWIKDKILRGFFDVYQDIELVSIDIFDTLIFRHIDHPMDLFEILCSRCIEKSYIDKYMTTTRFKNLRYDAENMAKTEKYKRDNVTLFEIYDTFPDYIDNKAEILQLELELEKEYCYLNPSMYSFIRHLRNINIPVILTSDMYLSRNHIEEILINLNFDVTLLSNIFISSDMKCTKRSGRLFKLMKNKYDYIDSNKIVHIGDNYDTDCIMAKINKINYLYYNVIPAKYFDMFYMENIYSDYSLSNLSSLRKTSLNMNSYINTEYAEWFNIGSGIIGPILALYCEYIANMVVEKDVHYIYPIMREGKLIGELLEEALTKKNHKVTVKPIYTSRQAILLPSLKSFSENYFKNILSGPMNVGELFELLKIEFPENIFNDIKDKGLYELSNWNRDKLINYFNADEIKTEIQKNANIELGKFVQYLNSFEFKEKIMFIDIGFSGTVMKALNDILISNKVNSSLIENMLIFGGPRLDRSGININCIEKKECLNDLMIDFFEEFINDFEGSTSGYTLKNNAAIPLLKENNVSADQRKGIQVCQEGIKYFCNLFFSQNLNIKNELLSYINNIHILFNRLIDFPSKSEIKLLRGMKHCNDYGNDDYSYIINNYSIGVDYYVNYGAIEKLIKNIGLRPMLLNSDLHMVLSKVLNKHSEVFVYGINKNIIEILLYFDIKIKNIIENNIHMINMQIYDINVISLDDFTKIYDFNVPILVSGVSKDMSVINLVREALTSVDKQYAIIS